jgi:hypothetical protein
MAELAVLPQLVVHVFGIWWPVPAGLSLYAGVMVFWELSK